MADIRDNAGVEEHSFNDQDQGDAYELGFGTAAPIGRSPSEQSSDGLNRSALGNAAKGGRFPIGPVRAHKGSPIPGNPTTSTPRFPNNYVHETPGGHKIEYDDTPENPRVMISHANGSGVEMSANGDIIINAAKTVSLVGSDDMTISAKGNANLVFDNLNFKVNGNLNMDVGDNLSYMVGGAYTKTVTEDKTETIKGNSSTTVVQNHQTTVGRRISQSSYEGRFISTKGDYNHMVNGDMKMVSNRAGEFKALQKLDISSYYTSVMGKQASFIGGQGTIGGQRMQVYGMNARFNGTVHGRTMVAWKTLYSKEIYNKKHIYTGTRFIGVLYGPSLGPVKQKPPKMRLTRINTLRSSSRPALNEEPDYKPYFPMGKPNVSKLLENTAWGPSRGSGKTGKSSGDFIDPPCGLLQKTGIGPAQAMIDHRLLKPCHLGEGLSA